ncbi:OpgC domain-containing protein [uncultured Gimesia sp.]|uniref:OpgC family protein n=1 Tax=uncultured Gimesia sp. TaxID=1678688 RepID=UPI0030DC9E69
MKSSDLFLLEKNTQRDLRIDFFRGLALMMILIDHVESILGVSLLSRFTLKSSGFCDAAEVFIFLSGYLYGRVYSRVHQKDGAVACIKKSVRRGFGLYLATLLTLCCCLAISVPFALRNDQIAQQLFLTPLLVVPVESTFYLADLLYTPYGFEILRLYILFFLILIPSLFLLLKWDPVAAWFLSIGLYAAAQYFSWFTIPMAFSEFRSFHFNPFSWQFLFFIGLVLGAKKQRGTTHWDNSRILACFSLVMILMVFYFDIVEPEIVYQILNTKFLNLFQAMIMKQTMAPFRLIHFLAIAFCVNYLTSSKGRFWKSKWASPLVVCGRNSLFVYCLGLVLMYLVVVLVSTFVLGNRWILFFHLLGGGISILLAMAIDHHKRIKHKFMREPTI